MILNSSQLLYKLVNANKRSIKKWDFGASFSNDYSVQVDRGIAKQLKASQKSSITIRVWNSQDAVGITSTSDLSELGLKKASDSALEASKFANTNESPDFSPQSKFNLPM